MEASMSSTAANPKAKANRDAAAGAAVEAAYAAAMGAYKKGATEQAVVLFEKLGALAPAGSLRRQQYLHHMIQIVGFGRKDHASAVTLCRQFTQEFPEYAAGWFLLGRVLSQLGEAAAAFRAFKRAWRLTAEARTAYELAKILHDDERPAMATKLGLIAYQLGTRTNSLYLMLANDFRALRQP